MILDDIRRLRVPLLIFAAVLLAATLLVVYGGATREEARRQLLQRQGELQQAELRIQNAGRERDIIAQYLAPFEQLANAGFIGEEQRMDWLDSLREANHQAGLFGVEYEISAQRPYPHAAELKPGAVRLLQSTMRVRLGLLHELDLQRFLNALERSGVGFFSVEQCVLRRVRAEVSRMSLTEPHLAAECELAWVTAQPPPLRPRKTP